MNGRKQRRRYAGWTLLAAIGIAVGMLVFAGQHNPGMFRKNVSKTPELGDNKAKLDMMAIYPWFPALKADGTPTICQYFDENGVVVREATEAKPLVISYTGEIAGTNGAHDVYGAVSRDDGQTWKRKNLSRMADRSSFTLENGTAYPGHCVKPVVQVKGNKILVAWTSKYARGGRPRYAIKTVEEGDDYIFDDPYWVDDIWGVGGPQRSVDYDDDVFKGLYPGVGEIPYSAVWICRGVVTTAADNLAGLGEFFGDIVWFKPERLTSGRRDALQIFGGGADGAGFGIVWQEDPYGLNPGRGAGPGEGWSGAIANKGTDIWYSYITIKDFAKVDTNFVSHGDPQHDVEKEGRPKALVPMSLPVRISDNEKVNANNALFFDDTTGEVIPGTGANLHDSDGDGSILDSGTRRYISEVPGLWTSNNTSNPYPSTLGSGFYDFVNHHGVTIPVAVTADGRLLRGNTAATRPNLNLQTYTRADGTKSAWALIAYEETHGGGEGAPDEPGEPGPHYDDYVIEEGKKVVYHTFDFQNPEVVSAGHVISYPEGIPADGSWTPVYRTEEDGTVVYDWNGEPMLAYENARRPRFILQGLDAAIKSKHNTIMVMVYKEGEEGHGRPSDIMMRRFEVSETNPSYENPYRIENLKPGWQNLSTVTVLESMDTNSENPDRIKVLKWEQTLENLSERSSVNPHEDARAHRGALRGDFLVFGYTWTPNWAAYRNFHDKYNFYIRRSFTGGKTWTTDPNSDLDVTHTEIYLRPDALEPEDRHYEEQVVYAPGDWEPARNVSLLKNNFESCIEPRIVAPYGTIKDPATGEWDGIDEDLNNPSVVYFSFGTRANDESMAPRDLFYSFTADKGQTLLWDTWVSHTGQEHTRWPWMAHNGTRKEDEEDGEVQLRQVPSGERLYAAWLQEGPDDLNTPDVVDPYSDIMMRRIIPMYFVIPENEILAPALSASVLGTSVLQVHARDDRPVAGVEFTLKEVFTDENGEESLEDIGQNGLRAALDPDTGLWRYDLGTTVLPDDYYVLTAKATDKNGNFRWSEPVRFSIKNWVVHPMYPGVRRYQAGRTIPIKYSLRIAEAADPSEPFVDRTDLVIRAYKPGLDGPELVQEFFFGEGADCYRVAPGGELYIGNFQTDKVPGQYMFEVRRTRNDFLLGSFTVETDRNEK